MHQEDYIDESKYDGIKDSTFFHYELNTQS